METPRCPRHNIPMKPQNKGGGFFCPKLVETTPGGDKVWCDEKVAAGVAAPSGAVASPSGDNASLAAAALQFAGSVFHQTQDTNAAIECAVEAYKRMKAEGA